MFRRLALLLLLSASPALATQYYTCFLGGTGACAELASCTGVGASNCSDACAGTLRVGTGGTNGPWCRLPGTRNVGDTAFIGPAVTLNAGDFIDVKAGTIHNSNFGGRVVIDSNHYNNGTQTSPITIRKAPAWGTGNYFTVDGLNMTVPAFFGLVHVGSRQGITLNGLESKNVSAANTYLVEFYNATGPTTYDTLTNSHLFNSGTDCFRMQAYGTDPNWVTVTNNIVDTCTGGGIVVWAANGGYVLVKGNISTNVTGAGNAADAIQIGGGDTTAFANHAAVQNNIVTNAANDAIDAGGHNCHDHYLVEGNYMANVTHDFKVHGNTQWLCAAKSDTFNIARFNALNRLEYTTYSFPNDTVFYNNTFYHTGQSAMFIYDDCVNKDEGGGSCPRTNPVGMGTASYGTGPGTGDRDFGRFTFKNNLVQQTSNGVLLGGATGECIDLRNSSVRTIQNLWNGVTDWGWGITQVCPPNYGTFTTLATYQGALGSPDPGGITSTQTDAQTFLDAGDGNFNLVSGSNAIDAGTWLTRATSAGTNSTTLTVERASYFHDGWDPAFRCTAASTPFACCTGVGVGTCGGPLLTPDSVSIAGGPPVLITAVNDTANTLTLATAQTWASGATVNLASTVGTAPDMGANEFGPAKAADIYTTEPGCSSWEADIAVSPTNPNTMVRLPFGTCSTFSLDALDQTPVWNVSGTPPTAQDPHVRFTSAGAAITGGLNFYNFGGTNYESVFIYNSTDNGANYTQISTPITSGTTLVYGGPGTSPAALCSVAEAATVGLVPMDFDQFGVDNGSNGRSSFTNREYLSMGVLIRSNADGSCNTNQQYRAFAYSSNGGSTWSNLTIQQNTQTTQNHWANTSDYAIMPSGNVSISTREFATGCIGLGEKLSGDGGSTWSSVSCALNNPTTTGSYPDVGQVVTSPSNTHLQQIAADPNNDGTVYMVFAANRNWDTAQDVHIWLVKSTNFGLNWSAPVKVDSFPFGSASLTNDRGLKMGLSVTNGRVDVIWTDTRNNDSGHTNGGDIFYNRSFDGGATFGRDFAINPAHFGDLRANGGTNAGDYIVSRSFGLLNWASYDGTLLDGTKHYYLTRVVPGH